MSSGNLKAEEPLPRFPGVCKIFREAFCPTWCPSHRVGEAKETIWVDRSEGSLIDLVRPTLLTGATWSPSNKDMGRCFSGSEPKAHLTHFQRGFPLISSHGHHPNPAGSFPNAPSGYPVTSVHTAAAWHALPALPRATPMHSSSPSSNTCHCPNQLQTE